MLLLLFSDPFANLDKNNDDFISKSETENLGIEWKSVADFDLNGTYTYVKDNFLSQVCFPFLKFN